MKTCFVKILPYVLFIVPVAALGIAGNDSWYNIAASVVAVFYLLLLNEGRRIGYAFGAVYAAGYAVISFTVPLYATAAYHAFVLLPTVCYRLFAAKKKEISSDISRLKLKGWVAAVSAAVAFSAALYFILAALNDAQPLLDGAVLALSLVTTALMLSNYMEMWLFNLFGSLLYVAIWSIQFAETGDGRAFAVMQAIVSVINVRGLVLWLGSYRRAQHSGA